MSSSSMTSPAPAHAAAARAQVLALGARRVDVAVTHALLCDDADAILRAAGVSSFLSTDTVPNRAIASAPPT